MGNWWCGECTKLERSAEEQAERIVKLERLVKNAYRFVNYFDFNDNLKSAHDWLSRYSELFPEAKK